MTDMTVVLPAEILDKIFSYLTLKELSVMLLVCRRWRQVGETPGLWASATVRVNSNNILDMSRILNTGRLGAVRKFIIETELSAEALVTLVKNPRLEEMVISAPLLSSKSVGSMIAAICDVGQCVDVDTDSKEYSKLTSLTITDINLCQINSELLSRTVTKLNTLALQNTSLTLCQINAMLTTVSNECNLINLDLSMNNLSSVDPKLLGRCVIILNTLNVTNTFLNLHQIEAILVGINEGSKPKNLNISQNNLETVDVEMLVRAVRNLETLNIENCSMSPQQIEVFLPYNNVNH